jgi:hypothetical protein
VFPSTALTPYKLINACEIFVTDSFSETRNSVTASMFKTHINVPRHFDDAPAHAREDVLFRSAAVASGTLKTNHGNTLQTLAVDSDLCKENAAKLCGQPS